MTPPAMSARARLSAPGTPVLEAYLLDFAGDLYGEEVELEFIAPLRADRTFTGGEALAEADAGGLRRPRASSFAISERTTRCVASPWAAPSKGRHWIVASPVARTRAYIGGERRPLSRRRERCLPAG